MFAPWIASITAAVTSVVRAVPPRSGVWKRLSAVTRSIAAISRWPAAGSPRWSSIITADQKVRDLFKDFEASGFGHYPVCMAKTQYSFSTDPALKGAPVGHVLNIRDVRLSAGAEFIVVICGEIMTMPGLPKVPSANFIKLNAQHQIEGLF